MEILKGKVKYMSLKTRLQDRYKLIDKDIEKKKYLLNKLEDQLFKVAEFNTYYIVDQKEYSLLLDDKKFFVAWLRDNDLEYDGTCCDNKFLYLKISWKRK